MQECVHINPFQAECLSNICTYWTSAPARNNNTAKGQVQLDPLRRYSTNHLGALWILCIFLWAGHLSNNISVENQLKHWLFSLFWFYAQVLLCNVRALVVQLHCENEFVEDSVQFVGQQRTQQWITISVCTAGHFCDLSASTFSSVHHQEDSTSARSLICHFQPEQLDINSAVLVLSLPRRTKNFYRAVQVLPSNKVAMVTWITMLHDRVLWDIVSRDCVHVVQYIWSVDSWMQR